MAQAFEAENLFDQAQLTYDKIVSDFADQEERWEAVLAWANLKKTRFSHQEAIAFLEAQQNKELPRKYEAKIFLLLADIYFLEKDYAKALNYWQQFIDKYNLSEHIPNIVYQMAQAAYALQQYEEVLTLLKEYELRFPDASLGAAIYQLRAQALAGQQDYINAEMWLQRCLREFPAAEAQKTTLRLLAEQYQAQKRYGLAVQQYQALMAWQTREEKKEILQTIAFLYEEKLHHYDKAREFYERIVTDFGNEKSLALQAKWKVANLHEKLQRYAMALAAYQEISEMTTDKEWPKSSKAATADT